MARLHQRARTNFWRPISRCASSTYATLPDSGGAGLHRGGNGITIAYELLEPGEISIHDDRWFTYPWGVNGGEPGLRSTKKLVRKNGVKENIPPSATASMSSLATSCISTPGAAAAGAIR